MLRFPNSGYFNRVSSLGRLLLWTVANSTIWLISYRLISLFSISDQGRFEGQLVFSRVALVVYLLGMVLAFSGQFKTFLFAKGSAVNLAVFRIIFFGFFAIGGVFGMSSLLFQVLPFTEMPREAMTSLPGMTWFAAIVPLNSALATALAWSMVISAFFAAIGLKTKWSILIFLLSAGYLFGIPNFFGKVNHNHHIIWFAFVLLMSPCAARLSVDAHLTNSEKMAQDYGVAYGVPIRIIWLLMGVIYFFPGFWKMWNLGLDWALSGNLLLLMFEKWNSLDGWQPPVDMWQYPFVLKTGGLFTLLFELSFLFWLINPVTRKFAAWSGLFFHLATWVFMNIFFVVLVLSYATFIDWEKLWPKGIGANKNDGKPDRAAGVKSKVLIAFVAVNVLFGIFRINSWPFTVYPLFDNRVSTETEELVFEFQTDDSTVVLGKTEALQYLPSERYYAINNRFLYLIQTNDTNRARQIIRPVIKLLLPEVGNGRLVKVDVLIRKKSILPGSTQYTDTSILTLPM